MCYIITYESIADKNAENLIFIALDSDNDYPFPNRTCGMEFFTWDSEVT